MKCRADYARKFRISRANAKYNEAIEDVLKIVPKNSKLIEEITKLKRSNVTTKA
jgi:hypothetical protein